MRGKALTKPDKEALAKELLADANLGKLNIFDDSEADKYYKEKELEKRLISENQFKEIVKIARNISRTGLDAQQLLSTAVIRNINTLDSIQEDLKLVNKHVKFCEMDVAEINNAISDQNKIIEKLEQKTRGKEELEKNFSFQQEAAYNKMNQLITEKSKNKTTLANFIKMKSALYKNVSDVMKNQTDLNYKIATIEINKEKNSILQQQIDLKNPPKEPGDDTFEYSDADVDEIEEIIKIQLADKKHLTKGSES